MEMALKFSERAQEIVAITIIKSNLIGNIQTFL